MRLVLLARFSTHHAAASCEEQVVVGRWNKAHTAANHPSDFSQWISLVPYWKLETQASRFGKVSEPLVHDLVVAPSMHIVFACIWFPKNPASAIDYGFNLMAFTDTDRSAQLFDRFHVEELGVFDRGMALARFFLGRHTSVLPGEHND
mgnify:CR=1 FL=1